MEIKMQGVSKKFGLNQVLSNVSFDLRSGEVHALMGENGAGKSTLMKILTGVYQKDEGTILVDGQEVDYKNPKEAEERGIAFIYQELNVVYDMTVEENLFLNKEITKFGLCDKAAMTKASQEQLDRLGVAIRADANMRDLSVGQQQMVEICKALMAEAQVIIMDEPTAALTDKETEVLFSTINSLKTIGVSIIYISHRMEEIFRICDRVTVLRDGQFIGTQDIKDTSMSELVKMMIGRDLDDRFPERDHKLGEEVLRVEGLSSSEAFANISFSVRSGEVLGISGLMGAGRTEIMQTIFGYRKKTNGRILIDQKQVEIDSPRDALNCGIAYVTEDRKNEGLLLDKSIRENIALLNLQTISKSGLISSSREREVTAQAIDDFKIKCFDQESLVGDLSGGNQQKVVISKWILRKPRILILDEPTRGVDVGAKQEIYLMINSLASQGIAIVMVSSELPELLGMSDRVVVIREGTYMGELDKDEATQEKVMTLATGGVL